MQKIPCVQKQDTTADRFVLYSYVQWWHNDWLILIGLLDFTAMQVFLQGRPSAESM